MRGRWRSISVNNRAKSMEQRGRTLSHVRSIAQPKPKIQVTLLPTYIHRHRSFLVLPFSHSTHTQPHNTTTTHTRTHYQHNVRPSRSTTIYRCPRLRRTHQHLVSVLERSGHEPGIQGWELEVCSLSAYSFFLTSCRLRYVRHGPALQS
jgi:hypothetical protein